MCCVFDILITFRISMINTEGTSRVRKILTVTTLVCLTVLGAGATTGVAAALPGNSQKSGCIMI